MVRRRIARALIALVLLALAGCGKPVFLGGDFPLVERGERPEEIKDFSKLYRTHCQGCHGPSGRDGPAPPLNDPLFLTIVPQAELHRVITEGRLATKGSQNMLMPPFARSRGGPLTDEQIAILVRNLHEPGKTNDWKKVEPAKEAPDYLLADALKKGGRPGDAADGAGVWAMSCASCHGERGEGKGKLAGAVNDAAFLALISDQGLRRIVITGRYDLGMPDYRTRDYKNFTPLTNQDVADVVAFVASWRSRPASSGDAKQAR